MNRILLFTVLLVISFTKANAQNSIQGKIVDTQKETLLYANIVLYQNNKPITGVVSDDNGNYEFKNIADGKYLLEVSVLGFKTVTSKPFELSVKNKHQVFNFTLKEATQSLDEVVIKSKRPSIKQTAEKLVVNLENSDMVSNNLQDVMKRVPGVIVTNNGISYAGQSVRILINGKTTDYMDMDTLLRDFPADNIAKIELIEQPGAEFDAEGSGPLVNIILKKNVKLGTHGNLKLYAGEDEGFEYNTSASIASYKNKLNWQASAGYSEPTWREDLSITRKVGNNATYTQESKSPFAPKNLRTSAGIDYYVNDQNTIGISASRRSTVSDRISTDNTFITSNNGTGILNTENRYERDRVIFNINPYYEFENEKDKLTIDFDYVDYTNNNINTINNVGANTISYVNQRYFQDGTYQIKTYKADYKHTFSENISTKFGAKYAQVNTDNQLKSFEETLNGTFTFLPNESNRFLIDETIFAVYSKLNYNRNKWSFSGGLRYENSNTAGTSTNNNQTNKRKISKLFPSASISRKITENIGAGLSYSYRIRRPSYSSLNSFVYYYNPTASERGNPNLKPAFSNNYQFNLTFDGQPFFSIGYRTTKDAMLQLISQDDATGEISRSMENLDKKENWNFRLFAPINFVKGLEGYTGIIVDYNKLNKSYPNAVDVNLSKWSLMWYTSAQYKLPYNINTELSGYYSTGPLEGQLEMDWFAGMDFVMSKTFLDKKLKTTFGIRKILNRQYHGQIKYANVDANIISKESKQNVYFQLTYNFGSRFGKKKSKHNAAKEEENRIDDNN